MLHQNDLLRTLSPGIRDKWLDQSQKLRLTSGQVIAEPQSTPSWVYFPIDAVLAWVNWLQDGASTAIALVGHEGMISLQPMQGLGHHLVVVSPGEILQVPARLVQADAADHAEVNLLHLRNQQALLTQISQTAVCNQHHGLMPRLLRLFQSILSRTQGQTVRLTHEQMANLLGTRRERISHATGLLNKMGVISCSRGRITITDCQQLQSQVCECCTALRRGAL